MNRMDQGAYSPLSMAGPTMGSRPVVRRRLPGIGEDGRQSNGECCVVCRPLVLFNDLHTHQRSIMLDPREVIKCNIFGGLFWLFLWYLLLAAHLAEGQDTTAVDTVVGPPWFQPPPPAEWPYSDTLTTTSGTTFIVTVTDAGHTVDPAKVPVPAQCQPFVNTANVYHGRKLKALADSLKIQRRHVQLLYGEIDALADQWRIRVEIAEEDRDAWKAIYDSIYVGMKALADSLADYLEERGGSSEGAAP